MHKRIDIFTDSHQSFIRARNHLGTGYLRGVVMDIAFDHFLSKHWDRFVRIQREQFIAKFYRNALNKRAVFRPNARQFIEHIVNEDVLSHYLYIEDLVTTFRRVDARLSIKLRARETLSEHYPVLMSYYANIEQDFFAFFPDLVAYFLAESGANENEHFLLC